MYISNTIKINNYLHTYKLKLSIALMYKVFFYCKIKKKIDLIQNYTVTHFIKPEL